jgi:hypothetical protein
MANHPNRVGANSVTIFATPEAAENVGEIARAALGHPFKVRVIKSAVTADPLTGRARVWQLGRSRLTGTAAEALVRALAPLNT